MSGSNFIPNIGYAPVTEIVIQKKPEGDLDNNQSWIQFHNAVANQINSAAFYGNPSELLNSDFNFNVGVPTPVTQADPDGTYISEKWQVHGAAVATYSFEHVAYGTTDYDPTGSLEYMHFTITNYSGDGSNSDFYIYQQRDGSQYLRQYQERIISCSLNFNNNQNAAVFCRFEIYFFYDGSTPEVFQGKNFSLAPGQNEISDTIQTPTISGKTIGGAPYMQTRFVFCTLNNNTADLNGLYLKTELAEQATVLYVDHALERVRIDA